MEGHHWDPAQFAWNPEAMVATPLASAPPEITAEVAFNGAAAGGAETSANRGAQAAPPLRPQAVCQIAGCGAALDDERSNGYNMRTKLWCNKLQDLSCFEGDKHTCVEKLREHNKRRRDRNAMRSAGEAEAAYASAAAEPPGEGALPVRARSRRAAAAQAVELIAQLAQGSGGDGEAAPLSSRAPPRRSRPRPPSPPPPATFESAPALRTALAMGEFDLGDFLSLQLPPPEAAANAAPAPPAQASTSDALAGMHAASVHIKLPNLASPVTLPQCLNGAALALFAAPPIAITALARPGCVLLTLDALLDGSGLLPARDAVAALKSGGAASFFRSQPGFSVTTPTSAATSGEDGVVHASDVAPQPPPPRVQPLAALAGADVTLRFLPASCGAEACACDADATFAARLHGHALQLRPQHGAGVATLAGAGRAEGVALIEVLPGDTEPQHAPPPRPMLLCADAAIVAEVCAAADATYVSGNAADAVERAAHVLGTALRPGASIDVLAAACAAAAERGWAASLARLLPSLRTAAEAAAPPKRDGGVAAARLCVRGGTSLLHRACAARAASAVALLVPTGDALFGAVATRGPDGLTPAHHAAQAAVADGGALMSMLTASGDGLVAWFYALDRSGAPPADYAPAALNAPMRQRLAAARARADYAVAAVLSRTFLRPELAAWEALTQLAGDDDAAAIVRWVRDALLRADADGGGKGNAPAERGNSDDGFMRWQAAANRPFWRVMALLLLLKALGNVVHCVRFLLYGPDSAGSAARAFVASAPLLDPSTGSAVLATDLPLHVLRRGAWHLLLATALIRVLHGAAAVWLVNSRAGWALTVARHEVVMNAVLLSEALFFVYTDALVRTVTGGLEIEWPAKLMLLRALAITAAMRTGPFRTPSNRAGMLARAASSGVALALRPALRGRL